MAEALLFVGSQGFPAGVLHIWASGRVQLCSRLHAAHGGLADFPQGQAGQEVQVLWSWGRRRRKGRVEVV